MAAPAAVADGLAARVAFRLYAITARQRCAPRPLPDLVALLAAAGVSAVQVREKDLRPDALAELTSAVVAACRGRTCRVLVNGDAETAARVGAQGVHLPVAAPPVTHARRASPGPLLVGCSAHTVEEAERRAAEGADFVTASPVYATPSKPGYGPALGLEGLRRICRAVSLPVFALAGVTPQRVGECLDQGAWGVAVMSGLMVPEGAEGVARAYLRQLELHAGSCT